MKRLSFLSLLAAFAALSSLSLAAVDPKKQAATVILDETGVKNLRIETLEVEESEFEETAFVLGRIRVAPGHRAVVSTRVPGRVLSMSAHIDTPIAKDAEVAVIESRQPGDPPPSVRITAPLGGLVSVVNVVPGQPVSPDTSLVEIIDLHEVHAVAAVPEHLVGKLQPGQTAHIRVSALPGKEFTATLAHLGAEADTNTGTLEAAFHVDNPEILLRPGMRAEFSIVINKREAVMSIPRAALQGDATDRFVYVADYELKNAFVKTPIQVGEINDRFVEVKEGLFPGDKVVIQGAYSLAFAGKGSISLKEALDAAHGHEHNEDGSEKTAGGKPEAGHGAHDDHEHGGASASRLTWISFGLNALLIIALCVVLGRQRQQKETRSTPAR